MLALVTSRFTLDKQNAALREYLGEKADFVGAIRLPSDAFSQEGTAVVTDIIFLRKRATGESARHEEAEWQRSTPFDIDGAEIAINRYFQRHPDMVLGDWSRKDTLYGEGYSIVGRGDLETDLDQAIHYRLPRFAPTATRRAAESDPYAGLCARRRRIGTSPRAASLLPTTGSICQMEGGQAVPVVYGGTALRRRHDDRQATGGTGSLA